MKGALVGLLGLLAVQTACETKEKGLQPVGQELRLCGVSSQDLCDPNESAVVLQTSAPAILEIPADDESFNFGHLVDEESPVVLMTGMRDYANYTEDDANPDALDGCLSNVRIVRNVLIFKLAESDWQKSSKNLGTWINNCLINLDLAYLPNQQFSVDRIETNVKLLAQENALSGTSKILYSVTGESSSLSLVRSLNSDSSIEVSESFVDDIWSSCSGSDTIGFKSVFEVSADSSYLDDNPAQTDFEIVSPEQSSHFFFEKGIVAVSLNWRAC